MATLARIFRPQPSPLRVSFLLQPTPRLFSSTTTQNADFTHAIIGGGVVGLAIARQLQAREGVSTVIIERHELVGMETSSRNSEVIHAGLYYGPSSLKTSLCLRGKQKLYETCKQYSVPHKACGKWIVAQDSTQFEAISKIHELSKTIGVPTRFVPREEASRREPQVQAQAGVLESPTTGIVDSHTLMQVLQGEFEELGGVVAFRSEVSSIEPLNSGHGGWEITTSSPSSSSTEKDIATITSETLINSAGLSAIPISNMILPRSRHRKPSYAKGTYYSYSSSSPRPKILVYPAPVPGHAGLGTHLTLDMSGRIRFGPDAEWTDDPTDYTPNPRNLAAAIEDIKTYLPDVDSEAIGLDYVGIRPKLERASATAGSKGFQDFYVKKEEGFEGFVNLLGIESPGLTSALGIGEMVEGLLYK